MMETGDDIPKRFTNTIGTGLNQAGAAVNCRMGKPCLNHAVAARHHERVVQAGYVIQGIDKGTFFRKGICLGRIQNLE